jgi:hypothetical protein
VSNIDRRTAALLAIVGPLLATTAASAAPQSSRAHAGKSQVPPGWVGHDVIAQLIYPNMLADFGAIPTDQRVVQDRNRITGAGVTSGLDFGLTMVSNLRDPFYAECTQLLAEYEPHPPFNSGSIHTAPAKVRETHDADVCRPQSAYPRARPKPRGSGSLARTPPDDLAQQAPKCCGRVRIMYIM